MHSWISWCKNNISFTPTVSLWVSHRIEELAPVHLNLTIINVIMMKVIQFAFCERVTNRIVYQSYDVYLFIFVSKPWQNNLWLGVFYGIILLCLYTLYYCLWNNDMVLYGWLICRQLIGFLVWNQFLFPAYGEAFHQSDCSQCASGFVVLYVILTVLLL